MKAKLLAMLLVAGGSLLAGPRVFFGVGLGYASAPVPYYAPAPAPYYAPPAAVYAAPVPAPGPGYAWVGGAWVRRPFAGAYWVAPRYYRGHFYRGYWRR